MIPTVAIMDCCWGGLVFWMHLKAPTPKTRRLTIGIFCYVIVETLFHVPMEAFAADVMRMISSAGVPQYVLRMMLG